MNWLSFLNSIVGRNRRDLIWLIFVLWHCVAVISGQPILITTLAVLCLLYCEQTAGHQDSGKLAGRRPPKWTLIQIVSLKPVLEVVSPRETGTPRASIDWEMSNT